jgi:hypothetical protein
MSVDYRLLHRFRVSQRREMAARGELPLELRGDLYEGPAVVGRADGPAARPRMQSLTYLVSEDR